MSLKILNEMERLAKLKSLEGHPSPQHFSMLYPRHSEKDANSLTKAIVRWIELSGGFATRMSVEGRVIEGKLLEKNVLGQVKRTPSKRIPSSNLKGSADITSCVLSVRFEVEVKFGRDTMKPAQLKFKEMITNADGFYIVAHNLNEFVMLWERFINYLPTHFGLMQSKSLLFIEQYKTITG